MAYNILIVDDSALTRTVMERTVRMCGVEVSEIRMAEHGKAALDAAQQTDPKDGSAKGYRLTEHINNYYRTTRV